MFKRDHHVRIATVLQSLDSEVFIKHNCYFGGGTAIVLSHDEYRESVDMNFLVSDLAMYGELRQALKSKEGFSRLLRKKAQLQLGREIRSDQYGIRTMVAVGDVEIKFEIIFESRIKLSKPNLKDQILGVPTLTQIDMATTKLLANSDRWADDSVFSRDLIDLAMLDLPKAQRKLAIEKAKVPYGFSVEKDLKKSIENVKNRPGRLSECMNSLKIKGTPEAVVWERIRSWM